MSIHSTYFKLAEDHEKAQEGRNFLMATMISLKNGSTTLDEIEIVGPNGEGGIKMVPKSPKPDEPTPVAETPTE
ncbi:hypothetical protein LCGC14_3093370 [marine sediment metagenome]|uniref:Uncharacterized protein n=1 Tax=marine sediment metagenome TaxID=412755 RepID=A0A0F8WAC9_9ZZZZ